MELERIIFEIFKDECLVRSVDFKNLVMKKYKLDLQQASDLYAKIINYQIDKYGTQLGYSTEYKTKEEIIRINEQVRNRNSKRFK